MIVNWQPESCYFLRVKADCDYFLSLCLFSPKYISNLPARLSKAIV